VRLLRDAVAELLLHLGDIGSEAVIDELVGHPARVVFGNCDDERRLASYAELVGLRVDHPAGEIEADGKRIVFTHGHLEAPASQALSAGVDYLLHGHTHLLRDERVGRTRVINPGALHRAARYTAVRLDPAADRLEVVEVDRGA
jgi:putative phosphoesterase